MISPHLHAFRVLTGVDAKILLYPDCIIYVNLNVLQRGADIIIFKYAGSGYACKQTAYQSAYHQQGQIAKQGSSA